MLCGSLPRKNLITVDNDIVDRLEGKYPSHAALDAADEIIRLRIEVDRLRIDLEEAYDACRYALANSPRWRENAETVVATWNANHSK